MRLGSFGAWTVSVVFVLAHGDVFAHAPEPLERTTGADQQLRVAHHELLDAARRADGDALASLIAEDITWVMPDGRVVEKKHLLAAFPPPPREVNIERIRPLGKAAVLTGVARFDNTRDVRFLQEWVKENGQWKLLTHQGTVIVPPSEPAPTGTGGSASATLRLTGGSEVRKGSVAPTLDSDDERAVWKTEQDLERAYLKGDVRGYTKFTAHEYSRIGPDGTEEPKYDFLKTFTARRATAQLSSARIETSDVRITVNGDTARLLMTMWETLPGGGELPPMRVTKIFQKRDGTWLQTASVLTSFLSREP